MPNKNVVRLSTTLLSGVVFAFFPHISSANEFGQTNLVSDVPGLANTTDSNLVNPWGVAFAPMSPFWISNQGSGTSTLYDGAGNKIPLTVTIPAGTPPATGPTGQVFAGGDGFTLPNSTKSAVFIFDTLNGTLDGWGGGTSAVQLASTSGAVYTGLAVGSANGTNYLYAADSTGKIGVFNSAYAQVSLPGNFTDPNAAAGYVPFNIQLIGSNLYVTYAKLTPQGTGLPGGYIDVYNTSGNFLQRFATGGALYAPWGLTLAPAGFGSFGGDLLVGNFGNGQINAYNATTGAWAGTLDGANGSPLTNDFLWSLNFRTGGPNANTNGLYFTAGINNQQGGLFGVITATPEPATWVPVAMTLVAATLFTVRRRRPAR